MRLELLEGVAAYYAGDTAAAGERLRGARAKWERLQVSDDRLADLLNMGFTASEVGCPLIQHMGILCMQDIQFQCIWPSLVIAVSTDI